MDISGSEKFLTEKKKELSVSEKLRLVFCMEQLQNLQAICKLKLCGLNLIHDGQAVRKNVDNQYLTVM